MKLTIAAPDSLLGQLQRGRGAGYLTALETDPAVLAPLLLRCILDDPRFDTQFDYRANYYARIALHAQMPLAPLDAALRTHTNPLAEDYPRLPLPVLEAMTQRGDAAATAILVSYLRYGPKWTHAFEAIVCADQPLHDVAELGQIVLARFPGAAELTDELAHVYDFTTWDRWAEAELRVAPVVAAVHQKWDTHRSSRGNEPLAASIDPTWEIPTLVAHATYRNVGTIAQVIAERATASDLPALLEVFFTNESLYIRAATRVLGLLQLPEAVPPLAAYVEQFDPEARYATYRLNSMRHILAKTAGALPLARSWLNAGVWSARSSVALDILEEQSEESDVLTLRQFLAAAIVDEPGDVGAAYFTAGCLQALKPFAEQVPYDELATVYERTWSHWTRMEAAEVLADGHPAAFDAGYAVECLWDCEDSLIKIGCDCADLAVPGVRTRLEQLRDSPWEEEEEGRKHAEQRLREASS